MKNIGKASPSLPIRVESDTIAVLVLTANVEQHFDIPDGATVAVFSATDNYYVLTNGETAAVPAVTSVAFPSPNTVPDLNPAFLAVTAGNLCSVIGPANCTVVINFYRGHEP